MKTKIADAQKTETYSDEEKIRYWREKYFKALAKTKDQEYLIKILKQFVASNGKTGAP